MSKFFYLYLLLLLCLPPIAYAKRGDISPLSVPGARTIDSKQAKILFDQNVLFVDVRNYNYYAKGHIQGAHHLEIPLEFTSQNLVKIANKEAYLVFYCHGIHCFRSSDAAKKAMQWGFNKVYYYRDGFPEWKKSNYPIAKSDD